jgi:hypothetical protein
MKKIAVAFSYPLCTRNFIHSGLLNELLKIGYSIRILSPYKNSHFEDAWGNKFQNTHIPTIGYDQWGTPLIEGVGIFHKFLFSVRLRGYSIEYPDGSLQTMELSRPSNLLWYFSWILVKLFPRKSTGRKLLRKIYDGIGPVNREITKFFASEKPDLLITSTMGHLPMDFVSLTVAHRHKTKTMCILLSWDNLYSRGPVYKHPDKLLVWSKMMVNQAIEVHQFSEGNVRAVGPLQFVNYAEAVTEVEQKDVRDKFLLAENDRYILYVCGGRTPQYDLEDIKALLDVIRKSEFADRKIIVRPHPQVDAANYEEIRNSVLLDVSPSLLEVDNPGNLFRRENVRHMAALLTQAEYVVSSWGTTVLLEACVFNKRVVQLNWFDSIPHEDATQKEFVKLFQRYYHMKEFDTYEGRLFSNSPQDLISKFIELYSREPYYSENRVKIKEDFTLGEYEKVVSRVVDEVEALREKID